MVRSQAFHLRGQARERKHRSHDRAPTSLVIVLVRENGIVVYEQVLAATGVEKPPEEPGRVANDLNRIVLTCAVHTQTGADMVEKGPETGAVDVEIRTVDYTLVPCHAAVGVVRVAVGEGGVGIGRVRSPRRGSLGGSAYTLPVGRFTLLHANIEVLRGDNVVLIQGIVLECRTDQPCSACGLDQRSAACGDDLVVACVEIVISCPTPHVLDVDGGTGRQVEKQECCFAWRGGILAFRFYTGSSCATHTEVRVPGGHITGSFTGHIYLRENASWEDIGNGKEHVRNLGNTDVTRLSDLDHGSRCGRIGKVSTDCTYG